MYIDTNNSSDVPRELLGVRKVSLTLGILTLALAIALTAWTARQPVTNSDWRASTRLSPLVPSGWTAEDRPLGETEFTTKAAWKVLRCDQAVYRVYRRDGFEVGLYIAYWEAGKIDPWEAAHHTPDTCWVLSGARCEQRDDTMKLQARDGRMLLPGNFRVFQFSQDRQETIFWLLTGGRPSGFPVTPGAFWASRIRIARAAASNLISGYNRGEQQLVRISTNRTIADVVASDLWPTLLSALAGTGVAPARNDGQVSVARDPG